MMTESTYKPLVHRLAVLTAVVTWPLIFLGGLVTSKQAGLSVPDWPNSFGYNMWLFPPSLWWNQGGIFYEHSHRLLATVVGLCAIASAIAAFWQERRPWVRKLAYGVLGFVIFQGVLGGLRVVLVNLDLAIVHGISAQLFFCTATLAAIVTSRSWIDAPSLLKKRDDGRLLKTVTATAFAIVFAQLVVGAIMRHEQAGLAIPDVPYVYGELAPPVSQNGLVAANHIRAYQYNLDPVTLTQMWLAYAHRIGATIVSLAVLVVAGVVLAKHRRLSLLWLTALAVTLLLVQVTLGVWTVVARKPADIASSHVAVGALLMVTMFSLLVTSLRLYSVRKAPDLSLHRGFGPVLSGDAVAESETLFAHA